MIISLNTMYVIPFPGIVGSGIPVNLDLNCSRIVKLKGKTKLSDLEVCISLREFFSRLRPFCPEDDKLTMKSELLKYIHGEREVLNNDLLFL